MKNLSPEDQDKAEDRLEFYKSHCLVFQKYFEVSTFELVFDWTEEDCRGSIYFDTAGRIATVFLNREFAIDEKTSLRLIEKVAFHEMAELFLADQHLIIEKHTDYQTASTEIHKIIRFLENKLFPVMG